ncbi:unnamed protein product [Rotaria sp. Silwood2]|nr:unnamed protein product [Rotaria sp. Silwood2]CAF3133013.1 unnamed protein product [Rotaria sp. Silwood2]CAF3331257.1 unnamed protein product [Rotaria sp. Silwood2]CAF3461954.1 unnamed protein product [Rotaria sp. Silwood2]CAF4331451.1 unnamed protein product [Rotaria sp. Silwood2]
MEYSLENVKTIIKAVCILHNICIDAQDGIETEWNVNVQAYTKPVCHLRTTGAADMRDTLADYFSKKPL